jgi:hypothetical protein
LKEGISQLENAQSNLKEKNKELIKSLEVSSKNIKSVNDEMQKKESQITSLQ